MLFSGNHFDHSDRSMFLFFCFYQLKVFNFIADFVIGPKVLDHAFEVESFI